MFAKSVQESKKKENDDNETSIEHDPSQYELLSHRSKQKPENTYHSNWSHLDLIKAFRALNDTPIVWSKNITRAPTQATSISTSREQSTKQSDYNPNTKRRDNSPINDDSDCECHEVPNEKDAHNSPTNFTPRLVNYYEIQKNAELKLEMAREEERLRQLSDCTFKPNIIKSFHRAASPINDQRSKACPVPTEEKELGLCTFSPRILTNNKTESKVKKIYSKYI